MTRWLRAAALASVTVVAAVATLAAIHVAERWAMPVVTDWHVDGMRAEPGAVVVWGTFVKHRECQLLQTTVRLIRRDRTPIILAQITPSAPHGLGVDAPIGPSTWGPMRIPALPSSVAALTPDTEIEVVAMHRCHLLWPQETVYGRVPAAMVIKALEVAR